MWNLMLKKDFGDVVIKRFKTRREAEEEIKNRERLTQHLGASSNKVYSIKRGNENGRTHGSL